MYPRSMEKQNGGFCSAAEIVRVLSNPVPIENKFSNRSKRKMLAQIALNRYIYFY